jgi:hypothetical protein
VDIVQQTPPSFLTRALRWLADFERAMDMQPVDRLELRVEELERRLAAPNLSDAPGKSPLAVRGASGI